MNVISGDKLRLQDMRAAPARSRRAIRTVVVAATFLVLVACSHGHDGTAQPGRESTTTSAPTTTSTTSAATTTSAPSPEAAVLAGYLAAKTALDQAQQIPDPSYPALAEHWTGDGLKEVRKQLVILKMNGWVIRGSTTRNPRVVSVKDSTAVVWDCIHTDAERYNANGEVVNPTGPLTLGFEETLVQETGVWKITARINQDQACAQS